MKRRPARPMYGRVSDSAASSLHESSLLSSYRPVGSLRPATGGVRAPLPPPSFSCAHAAGLLLKNHTRPQLSSQTEKQKGESGRAFGFRLDTARYRKKMKNNFGVHASPGGCFMNWFSRLHSLLEKIHQGAPYPPFVTLFASCYTGSPADAIPLLRRGRNRARERGDGDKGG